MGGRKKPSKTKGKGFAASTSGALQTTGGDSRRGPVYDSSYGMSPKLKDTLEILRQTTPAVDRIRSEKRIQDSSAPSTSQSSSRPLTRRETKKLNTVLENISEGVGTSDQLVDVTLNYSDRQNAIYKYYWEAFMRNWSRQVDELTASNRMNAANVKEMHDRYKTEFDGMDLWKWIVAAEDVQVRRDYLKDTECTIRALHGRFEILLVCLRKLDNEYVVVVNAYPDEVAAADGELTSITNSIPVNSSSSVVLYHLADVCAALAKARENIVDCMPLLGCEEVAKHSEWLDAISSCLLVVRPTFERPNTVNDWPTFFTAQKRRAVSISIQVCRAASDVQAKQAPRIKPPMANWQLSGISPTGVA